MARAVMAEDVGLKVAEVLGFPKEGLKEIEIKIKAGEFVRVIADYYVDDDTFSRFFYLIDKLEAKEEDGDDTLSEIVL